jgi:hypothetical protein
MIHLDTYENVRTANNHMVICVYVYACVSALEHVSVYVTPTHADSDDLFPEPSVYVHKHEYVLNTFVLYSMYVCVIF